MALAKLLGKAMDRGTHGTAQKGFTAYCHDVERWVVSI
jgi:hypothetical protein